MGQHSIVSPSSAHRWVKCTASIRHAALRPCPEEKREAKEGTAAHWVLSQMLAGQPLAKTDPDGFPIDDDMITGAALAIEAIAAYYGPDLKSEALFPIPRISPECFGTIDLHHIDAGRLIFRIWDYKHGWEPVEVKDNWQLIAYALGIMDYLRLDGVSDQAWGFELGIIQPRPWHRDGKVRIWSGTASDLRGPANILAAKAEEGLRGQAKYHTGAHCVDCPARHDCAAYQKHAAIFVDQTATPDLPLSAPIEQQGRELIALQEAMEIIKGRESGLRAALEAHARAGARVPGWGMVQKTGNLAWTIPEEEVAGFGLACGVDLSKQGVLTPTQAKNKGISPEILAAVSTRPTSMSFERVSTSDLERIFKK